MQIPLALLADYANVSAEGKLNIMGAFDVINARRFPAVHAQMHLVFRVEANSAEAGSTRRLEIKLMAADGQPLLSLGGELAIGVRGPVPLGEMLTSNHIIGLQAVRFEKPGAYQFAILINGDTKAIVPLKVQELPATPDQDRQQGQLGPA
jgi:hypothetical protein